MFSLLFTMPAIPSDGPLNRLVNKSFQQALCRTLQGRDPTYNPSLLHSSSVAPA